MFRLKVVSISIAVLILLLWMSLSYWNFLKNQYVDFNNQSISDPLITKLSQHQKLAEFISEQINNSVSLPESNNIVLFLNQISNINENVNISTKNDLTTLGIYWIDLSQKIYGPYGRIDEHLSPTQKINIAKCNRNPHQLIIFEPDLSKNSTTFYLGWGVTDENKKILGTLLFGIPIEHINHMLNLINSKTQEISSIRLVPDDREFNLELFKKFYSKIPSRFDGSTTYEKKLKPWPLSLEITYSNYKLNQIIGAKLLKNFLMMAMALFFLFLLKFLINFIKNRSQYDVNNQKKIINSLFLSIKNLEVFGNKIKAELFEKFNNASIFASIFRKVYEENPFHDKVEIGGLLTKQQSELAPINSPKYVKNNLSLFSIESSVNTILEMLYYHAIKNEVKLSARYDLKDPYFYSCEIVFQQILIATIYKAIENTPRSKVVDIFIHDSIETTKRTLKININDNGFGMLYDFSNNAETKGNLFTSSYQEISWEMIKNDMTFLNGELEIISTIQKGTNYFMSFSEFNQNTPLNQQTLNNVYYLK